MSKFLYTNPKRKTQRRHLRKNTTTAESLLWEKLHNKQLGYKFRRQYSIGPYIVDFYCPQTRLVVELDGKGHKENVEYDEFRSEYLDSLDIRVIRFCNSELDNNVNEVINKIKENLSLPS